MVYDYEDDDITPLTAEMCLHFTPPEYLIRGMLSRGELACIFGSPGAGKSMFALRLAYAVSRGDPISGIRTENGSVLYLAYEDFEGVTRRIAGLYQHIGQTEKLLLQPYIGNFYAEDEEGNSHPVYKLAKYARENHISLIVIDTLAIAFAGVEENDHKSTLATIMTNNRAPAAARVAAAREILDRG